MPEQEYLGHRTSMRMHTRCCACRLVPRPIPHHRSKKHAKIALRSSVRCAFSITVLICLPSSLPSLPPALPPPALELQHSTFSNHARYSPKIRKVSLQFPDIPSQKPKPCSESQMRSCTNKLIRVRKMQEHAKQVFPDCFPISCQQLVRCNSKLRLASKSVFRGITFTEGFLHDVSQFKLATRSPVCYPSPHHAAKLFPKSFLCSKNILHPVPHDCSPLCFPNPYLAATSFSIVLRKCCPPCSPSSAHSKEDSPRCSTGHFTYVCVLFTQFDVPATS